MNENINGKKKHIVIVVVILAIVIAAAGVIVWLVVGQQNRQNENNGQDTSASPVSRIIEKSDGSSTQPSEKPVRSQSSDYEAVDINGEEYYCRLSNRIWSGNFHLEKFYTDRNYDVDTQVVSYEKYKEIVEQVNQLSDDEIVPYYTDKNTNYIVLSRSSSYSWCEMELIDCIDDPDIDPDKIIIFGQRDMRGVMASGSGYLIAVPTQRPVGTQVEYIQCYCEEEIENLKKYNTPYDPYNMTVDKPIIYLYPEKETKISVELTAADRITCSYPKYEGAWNVLAQPDGNLTDLKTGKSLYALYYESKNRFNFRTDDGFIVKGEDSAAFLEEKLAVLGLNDREAEEFIVYWLPKLEANRYNYIRFAEQQEIEENMPLKITPKPDTEIRVLMLYKGLDQPKEIKEQKLIPQTRTGFTVVEWGGTILQ